ncbi:hypothetical protein XENOCAPTIV_021276 [Xenoophorus captivus]|uniref:Uncharacterized protein n=1 Tax=Xenoophorus captivus TaxID=1517983 RepID=A0ABV0RD00_9TELE
MYNCSLEISHSEWSKQGRRKDFSSTQKNSLLDTYHQGNHTVICVHKVKKCCFYILSVLCQYKTSADVCRLHLINTNSFFKDSSACSYMAVSFRCNSFSP